MVLLRRREGRREGGREGGREGERAEGREGGRAGVPSAVGGTVDVLGVEKGLGIVEPIVDRGVVLRVEVHVDRLAREGGREGGRGMREMGH